MGDTGVPKNTNNVTAGGYLTEILTFPPDPQTGWLRLRTQKRPACRHNLRVGITYADGHVALWEYLDLRDNKDDIFGVNWL
jgi:prepilin-type processing-associated H-X9-DG protein